ncbi:MAG: hypothetical protein WAQ57_02895 [Candidatus Saccharimonadales bacterium]
MSEPAPQEVSVTGGTVKDIEDSYPPAPAFKDKGLPTPDMFSRFLILEGWSHWFFRLGFASIFFVNAIYAVFKPASFASLLEANVIASAIGHTDLMVKFAIINDLLLGIFIVGGWRKQLVYGWAGAWLLLPAGLKLMNLVF